MARGVSVKIDSETLATISTKIKLLEISAEDYISELIRLIHTDCCYVIEVSESVMTLIERWSSLDNTPSNHLVTKLVTRGVAESLMRGDYPSTTEQKRSLVVKYLGACLDPSTEILDHAEIAHIRQVLGVRDGVLTDIMELCRLYMRKKTNSKADLTRLIEMFSGESGND